MHNLFSPNQALYLPLLSLGLAVASVSEAQESMAPDQGHFTKTMLVTGEFAEPIDMTIRQVRVMNATKYMRHRAIPTSYRSLENLQENQYARVFGTHR